MTAHPVRILVALWVCLGILTPQNAAILSALGLADDGVLVICTGDGLRSLRIDAEGNPVEISDKAGFCALAHAADTASAVLPGSPPTRLAMIAEPLLPRPWRVAQAGYRAALPRAPPRICPSHFDIPSFGRCRSRRPPAPEASVPVRSNGDPHEVHSIRHSRSRAARVRRRA